jgi:hypothetical protein
LVDKFAAHDKPGAVARLMSHGLDGGKP